MTTKIAKPAGGNGKENKDTAKTDKRLKSSEIQSSKDTQEKAEEIKQVLAVAEKQNGLIPIAERLEKIQNLQRKAERWQKLQEQKQQLEKFVIQSEGYTPRLTLAIDEKGLEYTAPIARIFEDVVKVMHDPLNHF